MNAADAYFMAILEEEMTDSNSQNNSPANNPLAQFLTPEAMLTPGVAGSLTMMITNALTLNFATRPELYFWPARTGDDEKPASEGRALRAQFTRHILRGCRRKWHRDRSGTTREPVLDHDGFCRRDFRRRIANSGAGILLESVGDCGCGPQGQSAAREDSGSDQAMPGRQQGHIAGRKRRNGFSK